MLGILFDWAIQPVGLLALAMLVTLASWFVAGLRPRFTFILFLCTLAGFWAGSTPSLANALVLKLEHDRQNPAECATYEPTQIVVLGGGMDHYAVTNDPYELLNQDSILRTRRALAYQATGAHIFLLGGGVNSRSLATSMAELLHQAGVPPSQITAETKSRSTHENAKAFSDLVAAKPDQPITLITSALHISRAAATFEQDGFSVCHDAVDSLYSIPKPPVSLLPYLSGLNKSSAVFHEIIARVVYRLKGYTGG